MQTESMVSTTNSEVESQWEISAIEAWLNELPGVEFSREREDLSDNLWSINGLSGDWQCQVSYSSRRLGTVRIYLCEIVQSAEAIPNVEMMRTVCESEGAEFLAQRGVQSWWGAGQLFLITSLRPQLLRPVVDRLGKLMSEIARQANINDGLK